MGTTAQELIKYIKENPDMKPMDISKKLGVPLKKVYHARYRAFHEPDNTVPNSTYHIGQKPEFEPTGGIYIPEETKKPVPVEMKVFWKSKYETFKGYDISSLWGL